MDKKEKKDILKRMIGQTAPKTEKRIRKSIKKKKRIIDNQKTF